jgi:hypothetical protein
MKAAAEVGDLDPVCFDQGQHAEWPPSSTLATGCTVVNFRGSRPTILYAAGVAMGTRFVLI